MSKSVQYTMPTNEHITLSALAKEWHISRKLLFKILEEKGFLSVGKMGKLFLNKKYGFSNGHVTRTAIYILKDKKNELREVLKIPKLTQYQKICFICRTQKGIKAFRERKATCIECSKKRLKKFKEDEESSKNCKDEFEINPYFLRRW